MSLNLLLQEYKDESLSGAKWHLLKRSIVRSLLTQGDSTIADLSASVQSSIPTVTKAVNELMADQVVEDMGKIANTGGRRPSLYSVIPSSGYLLGVDVGRTSLSIGLQDVKNEFVFEELKKPFVLEENNKSLEELVLHIRSFLARSGVDQNKIIAACISVSGRVDSEEGVSDKAFFNIKKPFAQDLTERVGLPVILENDTRVMTWGEYAQGNIGKEENVIFLNYDWGVSIGIVINGKLYYGKSGYSGEFGHSPLFDNKVLCYCGKEGCLETEVSGGALVRQFEAELKNGRRSLIDITNSASPYKEILNGALVQEDSLCLDLITTQCDKMGKHLAMLLNLFNPGTLIIGGEFAQLNDFVLLPIQASIRKHSVSLVTKDVAIKLSQAGHRSAVIGACYVVKEKLLAMLA